MFATSGHVWAASPQDLENGKIPPIVFQNLLQNLLMIPLSYIYIRLQEMPWIRRCPYIGPPLITPLVDIAYEPQDCPEHS